MLEMKRCFEFGIQWGRTNRRTNDFTINKYYTNSFSYYIKTLKQEIYYNKREKTQSAAMHALKIF